MVATLQTVQQQKYEGLLFFYFKDFESVNIIFFLCLNFALILFIYFLPIATKGLYTEVSRRRNDSFERTRLKGSHITLDNSSYSTTTSSSPEYYSLPLWLVIFFLWLV